ncbi:MAG: hypothetical protein JWO35_125 [Candidatus Saccharibacteria bacterium]|nr:hypothetical protein [Candidatus Saccharibacteria bacterium]
MIEGPETPPSGESKNKRVFDVFDRASSHRHNMPDDYFIGDGIVVRIGWVDNRSVEDPDLTIEIRDEKWDSGVALGVGHESSRYTRQNTPWSVAEWLEWSKEERKEAKQFLRQETFIIPTAALEAVASAVSQTEPGSPPGSVLWEAATTVEPLPSTDIEFIRGLVEAFSKPLD